MAEQTIADGKKTGFGTAAVFFTSISSILGAILFLRLGYATGVLGLFGTLAIIMLGHLITIPTAMAISELSTNTRVEGGGAYYIMSRSFGFKIGSTIGLTLFLSQTISIAFYTIAFAESFHPFFEWWTLKFGYDLPRQVISVPTLFVLAYMMLKKGSGSGMVLLYAVNIILLAALLFFFFGSSLNGGGGDVSYVVQGGGNLGFFNKEQFFVIFAICFPAFTGVTAGVGLSGDLRNPGKSIPLGTMLGTLTGFVIYILVVWKLAISAPSADLVADQMIMSKIALYGYIVIPIGLAACTFSSAIGSMMIAPRTLQAIAADKTFPFKKANSFLSRGRGEAKEPNNASVVSFAIALVFIMLGDINSVAAIISMFFLITYGTLCLSSFLNHFGASPSYRPKFKSKWHFSLAGFLLSVWVMFKIDSFYTVVSYILIIAVYLFVEHYNKDQKGLVNIFKEALFQLNRQLQVFMQRHQSRMDSEEWRPAVICVSSHSFEREKVLDLMKWVSHHYGFGTYFHLIEGYFSKQTYAESGAIMERLVQSASDKGSTLYIDTMISPSYTSAIAQVIQAPSISGMENNMVMFEYDKKHPSELLRILDNVNLVKAGNFDIGIFAISGNTIRYSNGIHVWIRDTDEKNTNFMILLGYIIMSHPDWAKSRMKIHLTSTRSNIAEVKTDIERRIAAGRLPITLSNIEIIIIPENHTFSGIVTEHSSQAALTIVGFREEIIKRDPAKFFADFQDIGDILFVNASKAKEIR